MAAAEERHGLTSETPRHQGSNPILVRLMVAIAEGLPIALLDRITRGDRTPAAIQRMVPEHAAEINGLNGWTAKTAPLPDGVLFSAMLIAMGTHSGLNSMFIRKLRLA